MPPKIDPYASKLQSRINVFLLILTIVVFAIVLRTSAHGQTFRDTEMISNQWSEEDWWSNRAAFFFPRYQFTLQSTSLVSARSVVDTRGAATTEVLGYA